MSRLTLNDALDVLGDAAVSGYSVFPVGATADQQRTLLNRAIERLIGMPSWRGIDVITTFAVYNNQITLPRSLQSIKRAAVPPGGNYMTHVPVNNLWFQFHLNGPGLIDPAHPRIAMAQANDIGLGYVTFLDPSAPFKLKIVTDVAEATSTLITFLGTDSNGDPIYTGTDPGVTLDCTTSGSTTTQVFGALTRVLKAVTKGRVKLYAVDASSGVSTLIAMYESGETNPSYRRYYITGRATETRTFTGLCKRAYVKLIGSNDEVYPDNINALISMVQSLKYKAADDLQNARIYEDDAVKILNDELGEYMADTSPAVQIQVNAFAGANIRNQR